MSMSWLKIRITSDAAVAQAGQWLCFAAAGLIPVLAFRTFATLEWTEEMLLLGILSTLSAAFGCTILGVLLNSRFKASAR